MLFFDSKVRLFPTRILIRSTVTIGVDIILLRKARHPGGMIRVLRIGSKFTAASFNGLGFVVDDYSHLIEKFNYDVVFVAHSSRIGIQNIVRTIKQENPHAWICYDNGHAVNEDEQQSIMMDVVSSASLVVVDHNAAEGIVGKEITSISEALHAVETLRAFGSPFCAIRGLQIDPSKAKISNILATHDKVYRFDIHQMLHPPPTDASHGVAMFTMMSLLLHRYRDHPGIVLERSSAAVSELYAENQQTGQVASPQLQLHTHLITAVSSPITEQRQQRYNEQQRTGVGRGYLCSGRVQGVIFDMDGTLTEPGGIDFAAMYTRSGLVKQPGIDILQQIDTELAHDAIARERALRVIFEEEMKGCANMVLRPDLHEVVAKIRSSHVRMAVSTRNCQEAYARFLDMCGLHEDTFQPALSRESLGKVNKPNPQVALHILEHWQISDPATVWFVGDSMDDIRCGKGAGCMTCLVGPKGVVSSRQQEYAHMIDAHVESLSGFYRNIAPHL